MMEKRHFGMEMRSLNILIQRKVMERTGIVEDDRNVTFMHGRVIAFLYANQDREVFQRDIEQGFDVRRPTATKILQSMERRGLVERRGVAHDARLKQVSLTEKAVRIHQEMVETFNQFERDLTSGLSDEALSAFYAVVDKVKQNLCDMQGPASD